MDKRPTIKDVALKAGVSTATVHLALNNKSGVGEDTRERIRRIARDIGYRPNHVAAGLKRKAIRIAAVLPVQISCNKFYFTYQWDGITDYINSMRDYNVQLIPAPYYGSQITPSELLDDILKNDKPDALLCEGFLDARGISSLKRYRDNDIPVALIGNDAPETGRLCCVTSPYEIIGRLLAEMLVSRVGNANGRFLIGAGEANLASHYLVVQGFESYMNECGIGGRTTFVGALKDENQTEAAFLGELEKKEYIACCAVTARDSVALARALIASGKAGTIPSFGSDVFPENVEFLKSGVFCGLIQKNPYQQGMVAAQYILESILQNRRPPTDAVNIGAEMVFKSNLPLYDNGFYRLLY